MAVDDVPSSGDLEAIALVDDGSADAAPASPPARRARARRDGVRRSVLLATFAALLVGLGAGVVIGRSSGGDDSGRAAEPSTDPSTVTATSSSRRGGALPVLFTHVSPTGAVVVARQGRVATAEAYRCPGAAPARPLVDDPACARPVADGVQFDFSASGTSWYRLTVLDSELGNDQASGFQPVAIESAVRLVRADRTTAALGGDPGIHIAAFHSSAPIAIVRVALTDGRTDAMTPVDGWSAFAETGASPFRFAVEGLDASGRRIARTQSRRWH